MAKNVLHGDTATALTHPWWPAMTRYSLYGGCHLGLISFLMEVALMVPSLVAYDKFIYNLLPRATYVD